MSDMRIYVADLAAYNNGILYGAWIDATADVEEMQEEVNAMLRGSPCPNVMVPCPYCEGRKLVTFHNSETGATRQDDCPSCRGQGEVPSAEEWAIHDFEGVPSSLGEDCGLQAVADFVGLVDAVPDHVGDDDGALEVAIAAVENWHSVEYAKEAVENNFVGIFDTFRDYADEAAEEMIACHTASGEVPQELVNYFDYGAYARDLAYSMTVLDVPSGVAVFYR